MRTLVIGLTATLVAVICWSFGLTADEPTKKFGPEWTKDASGKSYTRKQVVEVSHPTDLQRPYTWYTLPSESHNVTIKELDEKGDITIDVVQGKEKSKYMRLEARMNDEGEVREFTVNFKRNYYLDLDGDGMIDCFYDMRDNKTKPMVIFEGQHIQVEDFICGFSVSKGEKVKMWGIGRKVQYVFEGSAWVAVPQ